jgi:hypothetical protein
VRIPKQIKTSQLLVSVSLLSVLAITIGAVLVFTNATDFMISVVDDLILNKSQSTSGLERKAWAMGGLEVFVDTWGLGAGTGSIRSNGLIFVLLGSVGLPGTLAFLLFLALSFGGRAAPGHEAILSNARMAALTILISMSLTATVPDPGVPLIFLAAIAVTARQTQGDALGLDLPPKNAREISL